jgi:hypothetical protein
LGKICKPYFTIPARRKAKVGRSSYDSLVSASGARDAQALWRQYAAAVETLKALEVEATAAPCRLLCLLRYNSTAHKEMRQAR